MGFKVGDTVAYHPYGLNEPDDGQRYTVELVYADGVYLISNTEVFVDLVNDLVLRPVNND